MALARHDTTQRRSADHEHFGTPGGTRLHGRPPTRRVLSVTTGIRVRPRRRRTDRPDWLAINAPDGSWRIAFQQIDTSPEATWPDGEHPQMAHLDSMVSTVAELDEEHSRAMALGARLLRDLHDDPEEPIRIYADPAGHLFCIFVGA
ncbi:VOC family protein [Rhodococcus sp. 05-340-2]|uniref:VOC family protein n=1 Tax=Rhodococcus sp. 05-340-2 TaxID=2022504 RepID=UPI003593680E